MQTCENVWYSHYLVHCSALNKMSQERMCENPFMRNLNFFLQQLDQEAQRLISEQPSSSELIEEKQREIMENWEQLTQRADERY